MVLRAPHGAAARSSSTPRVEVAEARKLPVGVLDPKLAAAGTERGPDGRFVPGVTTKAQVTGARARKNRLRLLESLHLADLADDHAFVPHLRDAEGAIRDVVAELAGRVGAGELGPTALLILRTAAMQTAASTFFYAHGVRASDPALIEKATKLGEGARQNLIGATEIAARIAKAKPSRLPPIVGAFGHEDDADDVREPPPLVAPAEGHEEQPD